MRQRIIDDFHKVYCDAKEKAYWCGVQILKTPLDLWIYQEILYEVKPDLVIECGTFKGGSALYFSHILEIIGNGRVITIDTEHHEGRPAHPRLRYILGSSTNQKVLGIVRDACRYANKVMVILDSDHSETHVLDELNSYKEFVSLDSYIVVEDTNLNGHPVLANFGPGPMEALQTFMVSNRQFESDLSREKFLMTFNPKGYLRRVK